MSLVIGVACALICAYLAFKWYRISQFKQKLSWMPSVPGYPLLGNLLEFTNSSTSIGDTRRLTDKYGKFVFLDFATQPRILTMDYDFLEFLLSSNTLINKSIEYELIYEWLGNGLLLSEGSKWRKRRRLLTPAFHFSILEQFIESFESNGNVLISKLNKEVGKDSVNIYSLITLYALDVICESAMGVTVDAQSNEESEYVKNVKYLCTLIPEKTFSVVKRTEFLYRFTSGYRKEQKALTQVHAATRKVIEARIEKLKNNDGKTLSKKGKPAFLDILLQCTDDGKPLTLKEIQEETDTFMFEGHDTTASAMSFTLYLIAQHPDVQKRLFEEQRSILGDDLNQGSTYNDLQNMKYMECVIKESLRMYPSVPFYGRRTHEDIEYKGHIIPKGVDIMIFTYGVLTDPDNYENPSKFDPSRFETMDGTRPYKYIPFSAGSRNCIGQKFAMLEMKSTISQILRHFELSPAVPEHKMDIVAEAVLKSRNGVRIKVSKRKW